MKRLAYRLWGGEPWLRFAAEATTFLVLTWTFVGAYGLGHEVKPLLWMAEGVAAVLVVDFLGFAGLYYWEGK